MVQNFSTGENHRLPSGWADQILRAYQVFSVDSGPPIDRFGIMDFIRHWTPEKRSAKAKRQLRHPETKRWVKERGSLDLPHMEVSRASLNSPAPTGFPSAPAEAELADVQPLSGQAAREALEAAGFKNQSPGYKYQNLIDSFADTHAVFTRDGKSFVVVPKPTRGDWDRLRELQEDRKFAAEGRDSTLRYIAEGGSPTLMEMLQDDLRREEAALRNIDNKISMAEKVIAEKEKVQAGIPDDQLRMAQAALPMLERARAKLPAWRRFDENGQERPILTNIDRGAMIVAENGNSYVGGEMMNLNPEKFWNPPDTTGRYVPRPYRFFGEGTLNHEMGHIIDTVEEPRGSRKNEEVWEAAKLTGGMSEYGSTSPAEGYAEAWTLWSGGYTDHPVARLYAEEFGWDQPEPGRNRRGGGNLR